MENEEYKILVVDDIAKNVQLVVNLLTEKGFDVEYALNGPDALTLVDSEDFDLILLDIMMPGMDGFEVCRKMKLKERSKDIPIIFLTAKTDIESIEKAFKNGGVDYVNKPFNGDELLARVQTHVDLKVSKDKLKEVNRWLEEKVKERTAELKIANEKLLELDKAKSEFLNIISHEIRTPLNGIIGVSSIIKECGLTEESFAFIDMLDQSANRLEDFSIKALDISMFNIHGQEAIKFEEVKISPVISKAISDLDEKIKIKGIEVVQTINTGSEIIKADSEYFSKCIFNIIDNAINYSPVAGCVSIEVRSQDNNHLIEIKDEGPGFDKGFDINDIGPFAKKDHVDKNPGLGLYLSNQIIKAHGGTIENGNNEDKGAFVRIMLNN